MRIILDQGLDGFREMRFTNAVYIFFVSRCLERASKERLNIYEAMKLTP